MGLPRFQIQRLGNVFHSDFCLFERHRVQAPGNCVISIEVPPGVLHGMYSSIITGELLIPPAVLLLLESKQPPVARVI